MIAERPSLLSRLLRKGPVPVGEPPVSTKSLSDLARRLGGSDAQVGMGPGSPVPPSNLDEGQPRRWDYSPGYNQTSTPRKYEGIDFPTLRAFSENYDIARLCVEKRKDDLRTLAWSIRPRQITGETRAEGKTRRKGLETAINSVTGFFLSPNQEDPWGAWLVQWAHQLFTIDAATLYLRPTLGGDLHALEVIDGASIFEIVDEWGRLPEPPEPAYVQVIRGMSSGWWSRDQIIRAPYWQTPVSPYGSPPAEWIMMAANRALRRQTLDLSRFTEGNIPAGFLRTPEGWDMTQIKELRQYLDGLLAGNDKTRSRLVPIPSATSGSAVELMNPEIKTEAEEWLMHITCAAYGVNPRELGFQQRGQGLGGKGDAEVGQEISFRRSVRNPALHLKGILDRVIAQSLGQPDLEFYFDDLDQSKDLLTEAKTWQIWIDEGVSSPDWVAENVLDIEPPGVPGYVRTGQGVTLVADLLNPPAPVVPPPPPDASGDAPSAPSASPDEATADGKDAAVAKSADEDLAAWQRKALRALKEGRSPSVRFASDAIHASVATGIGFALAKSTTADDVRAAFTLAKAGASAGPFDPISSAGSANSGPTTSDASGARPSARSASSLYPSTQRPAIPGTRTSASSSPQPPSFSR